MTKWISPCKLESRTITLVPLLPQHAQCLGKTVDDGQLNRLWYATIPDPAMMTVDIARRLALQAQGQMLSFAVIERATDTLVGTTSYLNLDMHNKRLEIGDTWFGSTHQGTSINTESKLLLLHHAFDALDCIAVEFRVHSMNKRARKSVERLGASLDGVLRAHAMLPNGALQDTAVYSILSHEWPAVRVNLEWLIEKHSNQY